MKKEKSRDQKPSTSEDKKLQEATKDRDASRASSALSSSSQNSSSSKSSHKASSRHSERSHTQPKPALAEGSVRKGSRHTTPEHPGVEGDRSRPNSGPPSKSGTPANRSRPNSGPPSKGSTPANRSRPSSGHSQQPHSRQSTPANQSRQPSAGSNVSNSKSETRRLASGRLQGSATPSAASQRSGGDREQAEETMSQVSGEGQGMVKPRLSTAEFRAEAIRQELQQ